MLSRDLRGTFQVSQAWECFRATGALLVKSISIEYSTRSAPVKTEKFWSIDSPQ